ncbi:Myb-like DNA-binding domain containing protein [Tritrichomonas foetus]|uniref:Myb-like DNA-binding domain containing protein n=1 Tax=Tritrichomonas foetus TaxID=1144522 RepID=A0A1J4J632_9EUKA|nr:Myb-like DNA-binding domain containing protein [Tritrichomonas foetus]|eukprot:OHS94672.1 Myb-like DNA-binding domain containing protein [Tritrichomonas foetus]
METFFLPDLNELNEDQPDQLSLHSSLQQPEGISCFDFWPQNSNQPNLNSNLGISYSNLPSPLPSVFGEHPLTRKRETNAKSNSGTWTAEEDELLKMLVEKTPHKKKWQTMAAHFNGKTAQQIMNRWNKVLNPNLIKGNWTPEEDEILKQWVQEKGEKYWTKVAKQLPGRIGKQCRERWMNCLKPDINKKGWTEEEDQQIIQLQSTYGNKWAKMAEIMHGRTDNQIKNRWNSVLKKRISLSVSDQSSNETVNDQSFIETFSDDMSNYCFDLKEIESQSNQLFGDDDDFESLWYDDSWMEKDR